MYEAIRAVLPRAARCAAASGTIVAIRAAAAPVCIREEARLTSCDAAQVPGGPWRTALTSGRTVSARGDASLGDVIGMRFAITHQADPTGRMGLNVRAVVKSIPDASAALSEAENIEKTTGYYGGDFVRLNTPSFVAPGLPGSARVSFELTPENNQGKMFLAGHEVGKCRYDFRGGVFSARLSVPSWSSDARDAAGDYGTQKLSYTNKTVMRATVKPDLQDVERLYLSVQQLISLSADRSFKLKVPFVIADAVFHEHLLANAPLSAIRIEDRNTAQHLVRRAGRFDRTFSEALQRAFASAPAAEAAPTGTESARLLALVSHVKEKAPTLIEQALRDAPTRMQLGFEIAWHLNIADIAAVQHGIDMVVKAQEGDPFRRSTMHVLRLS